MASLTAHQSEFSAFSATGHFCVSLCSHCGKWRGYTHTKHSPDFFFFIDFHFLTMEGVPSLIGVLFLPIGLCGLLSL